MRSIAFEHALCGFAEDASEALQSELSAGAEMPFELVSRGRPGAGGLCMYQPLPGRFIRGRVGLLRSLRSYTGAVLALRGLDGLERYLAARGSRLDAAQGGLAGAAEEALVGFLEDVFDEQSDFEVHESRLSGAVARMEAAASSAGEGMTFVATLHGVGIVSAEVAIAPGLRIARPEAVAGLPERALWRVGWSGEETDPGHLVVLARVADGGSAEGQLRRGEQVLRDLLRGMRLFGDGRITLGPMVWVRRGEEGFSPLAVAFGGRPHGMLVVTPDQEDELRAFCSLVSRRAPEGDAVAWALRRFEMGCEREREHEALSDHILGLQALLEGERSSPGLLAARVAALCAPPERRPRTAERVLEALRLEREVVEGEAARDAAGVRLVREMAGHLRALLSDVICGHLGGDIQALADELLLEAEGQPEYGSPQPERWSPHQVGGDAGEGVDVLDVLVELGDQDRGVVSKSR